jgi:UDP-N-acetylmuramoylalanine--D-glutamate ligase
MEYVEAKRNILNHQTADDFAVLNWDYPATRESDIHTVAPLFQVSREQGIEQGAYVEGSEIRLKMNGKDELLIKASDLKLPGKHNLDALFWSVCGGNLLASR